MGVKDHFQCTMRIIIDVNDKGHTVSASGDLTAGEVLMAVGAIEKLKRRLLFDYEKSLNEGY